MTWPDLRCPKDRVDITKFDDHHTSAGKCFSRKKHMYINIYIYIYIFTLEENSLYTCHSDMYLQSSKKTWKIPFKIEPFLHLQYQWVGPSLDPPSLTPRTIAMIARKKISFIPCSWGIRIFSGGDLVLKMFYYQK